MMKNSFTELKYRINHFIRIYYSKKLLRLNKKKVFNQNEYVYRENIIKGKINKIQENAKDRENKINDLNNKLVLDFNKIDNKSKKLEEKIRKTKETRDHYHRLLLIKIENKMSYYHSENEQLKKECIDLQQEKDKQTNNLKRCEEIDMLLAKKQDLISQNNRKFEILETRDRITNNKDILLSLSHVTMKFGGLKAVDDLSFDVKKGEIFGLIGPNGAGKTTVFNCITQFYKPNEGDIFFNDINEETNSLIDYNTHDIINLGIVRTFQNVELVWELNVMDNLLVGSHSLYSAGFFSQLFHLPKLRYEEKVLKDKATNILKKLGILEYKDVFPYGLPYGILKKIEMARTLMTNPSLIILDEPAAGLNDLETKELAQLIRSIRDEFNLTIFLVEHDMGLVMDICDRICAVSFGSKLAIGTPSEIQKHPKVQEAYLGGE